MRKGPKDESIISHASVFRPVSSFSTSRLNSPVAVLAPPHPPFETRVMQTNNLVGLFRKSHGIATAVLAAQFNGSPPEVLRAIPRLGPESHIFDDHGNPIVFPFHTTTGATSAWIARLTSWPMIKPFKGIRHFSSPYSSSPASFSPRRGPCIGGGSAAIARYKSRLTAAW